MKIQMENGKNVVISYIGDVLLLAGFIMILTVSGEKLTEGYFAMILVGLILLMLGVLIISDARLY